MDYKQKEVIGDCEIIGFPVTAQIYAIEGDCVVYIGSTINPIKSRVRTHLRDAKNGSGLPIHEWIRKRNYNFKVRFIEAVDEKEREARESHWIRQYKDLLNMTDGGKGMSGHKFAGTPHAQRIGDKIKTGATFQCLKCGADFWRKRSEIIKGNNKYCSRQCSNRRCK